MKKEEISLPICTTHLPQKETEVKSKETRGNKKEQQTDRCRIRLPNHDPINSLHHQSHSKDKYVTPIITSDILLRFSERTI
jgi:hypothetical protein